MESDGVTSLYERTKSRENLLSPCLFRSFFRCLEANE
jgi:hypothetical protein